MFRYKKLKCWSSLHFQEDKLWKHSNYFVQIDIQALIVLYKRQNRFSLMKIKYFRSVLLHFHLVSQTSLECFMFQMMIHCSVFDAPARWMHELIEFISVAEQAQWLGGAFDRWILHFQFKSCIECALFLTFSFFFVPPLSCDFQWKM